MNFGLLPIAKTLQADTKTAARAALKAAGLKQTLVDELLNTRMAWCHARRDAPRARLARRMGYSPIKLGWMQSARNRYWRDPSHGEPKYPMFQARMPDGTIHERLRATRERAVRLAYASSTAPDGVNDQLQIEFVDDLSEVGFTQSRHSEYRYRGAHRGRPMNYYVNTARVSHHWRVRVARRGLAVCGGLLTLDAAPMDGAPAGVNLYYATWIARDRGNSAHTVRGYIARSGDLTYHADSPEGALVGLRRKVRNAQFDARLAVAPLDDLIAGHEARRVSLADAYATGACDPGIRAWCARVGIDYASGRSTVGEVYAGYLAHPLREARAVLLHVLKRAR